MNVLPTRRLKKFYEQVLLSRPVALLVGWCITVALPLIVLWGPTVVYRLDAGQKHALTAATVAFIVAHLTIRRLMYQLPGGRSHTLISTHTIIVYGLTVAVILLLQVPVSRSLLTSSAVLSFLWLHLEFLITRNYFKPKLAVITGGLADEILKLPDCDARALHKLDLAGVRYDGVVADFQAIDSEAERFLTRCALSGVAVYNAKTAYEALSGRVKINKMIENNIGSLLPSVQYERSKNLIDWLLVLISLPISLPLFLLISLAIKLDSRGPVLFTQTRIGKGNKPFIIYKFRSMYVNEQNNQELFTKRNDPRITRIGKIIRPLRLDELPQLINVLKGDMNLVGPRPEQIGFVEHFEKQIPFYSYRHVIKPGITGWAQVCMGYAASTDATQAKIEFDFYYIKNCSLTLDFFIGLLTVRTILTGYGAR